MSKIPQILVGTALPKLLANISGDANTLDAKHAASFAGITLYTVSDTSLHTFTLQAETAIPNISQDVAVLTGDIVIASIDLHLNATVARACTAFVKLFLGANASQPRAVCSPVATYYVPVALIWAATAGADATWTITPKVYVYTAGDKVYTRYEEMVILRIRMGG